MVLEAGDITPPLDSMPICSVGPDCMVRERVSVSPELLADSLAVASEHFKAREMVGDVCLIKAVMTVGLLPLE